MLRLLLRGCFAASSLVFALAATADQLRIASWNISNYDGADRAAAIQNSLFGTYQNRQFAPDVLFTQETLTFSAANTLKTLMNTAVGSAGDYDFHFGTSGNTGSQTAVFFRTSLVAAQSPTLVAPAGGTSANPRDVFRFDFTLNNNAATNEVISVYNLHMKSGTSAEDQDRRQVEAQLVRDNANALATNHQLVVLGDFNIQSSNQTAYQTFTTAGSNARGQVFDPIGRPGSWNNNATYSVLHTQDPSGAGGMDDRHDQILLGSGLNDGQGTEYVGQFGQAFDLSTWDDQNHSYRVWGNDGTSFNASLTTSGNTMVGESIAQSLVEAADNGGHLPVYLDLSYEAVPEPATLLILTTATLATLARKRRS